MTGQVLGLWHQVVSTQDLSGVDALLADDAVFYSPIVHTPQRGKALVAAYLGAALTVFVNPAFRYVRETVGLSNAVLEFETEIDGVLVNGVDLITWNDVGQIIEFKVMIRPLKAINVIGQRMATTLQFNR